MSETTLTSQLTTAIIIFVCLFVGHLHVILYMQLSDKPFLTFFRNSGTGGLLQETATKYDNMVTGNEYLLSSENFQEVGTFLRNQGTSVGTQAPSYHSFDKNKAEQSMKE